MVKKHYIWIGLLLVFSCIDSFEPDIESTNSNFLVVEGALILGNEPTVIKLSRTANLGDTAYIEPELSAEVSVVAEDGTNQMLIPDENGKHQAILDLEINQRYYLTINTRDGTTYRSELISPKQTPPIDSLSWKLSGGGELEIYVNTHDDENNSIYYKWDYVETWEFNAAFNSFLEYKNGEFFDRPSENQIYTCWQNNRSKTILLGSSAALRQDIIYQQPVLKLPLSWKVSKKYSIVVNQHTLSKEAYTYFENMKKNSEGLGSFYDAQPTEIKGNLYAVDDPEKIVVGYVYATSVQQKRIFIKYEELEYFHRETICTMDELKVLDPNEKEEIFEVGSNVPVRYNEFGAVLYVNKYCGDCTVRGFNKRPSFWE